MAGAGFVKVLVIPEDPKNDQFILKPIVDAIFADMGRRARIDILREPRLRGVAQALDREIVAGIVADNPMVHLFILAVDRDCDAFENTAKAVARRMEHPDRLVACLAVQEVEVWMLALHREMLPPWQEIRAECHPKERYAEPFLQQTAVNPVEVGGGRKRAMAALTRGTFRGLLQVCDELRILRDEIEAWCQERQQP
jgi:hypothetical protein